MVNLVLALRGGEDHRKLGPKFQNRSVEAICRALDTLEKAYDGATDVGEMYIDAAKQLRNAGFSIPKWRNRRTVRPKKATKA